MEWQGIFSRAKTWSETSLSSTQRHSQSFWTLAWFPSLRATRAAFTRVSSTPGSRRRLSSRTGSSTRARNAAVWLPLAKCSTKCPRDILSLETPLSAPTKSGFLDEAVKVFGSMPDRDQCSWNSLVSGFSQHGRFDEALKCLVNMHAEDFMLNSYSFGSALSACSGLGDLKTGIQIHSFVSKSRCSSNVYMRSALVDMYSKCGSVACSQRVFDWMKERNRVLWNSLISCYEQNGPAREALEVLSRMMKSGLEPDEVTLASVVRACVSSLALKEGSQIHARVVKHDRFRDDLILGNALVDLYAKCGRINEARCIFDRMPIRNVVLETSMVSGYAKAAIFMDAKLMFSNMTERNVISWNALISGYTQIGENEEGLSLFLLLGRVYLADALHV